ncbi:MAG TPA: dTMP kinase [Porticoccaceae bacterium]|nr:dTMP kinase [Porticoccaceae bacterium]HCO58655.1 dTMP kinase [Porticoccaceae bacterium]
MLGKFITLEGTEGVGKSTCIAVIEDWLKGRGVQFVSTREPGGTSLGEELRELLLAHRAIDMAPLTELLLVFAARAQHLAEKIRPTLASGAWVLCDRFTDATFAYQGAGRGLDEGSILTLAKLVHDDLAPDLTILLDVDPEVGLKRAGRRGGLDRFEREDLAFFERVREGYHCRMKDDQTRFSLVNAGESPASVAETIKRVLDTRFPG